MPAAKSPAPAPGSKEKLDRLRALLREMFQLDRGNLDFGLYRIMNMKAAEIKSFLDDDLLPQVQEKLQGISAEERERLEKGLSETIAQAKELGGIDPEDTDKVKSLHAELKEAQADAEAEADVYNHLANFFSRYYSEGDFMSLRRYSSGGKAEYLIPYNGEEVKLHWANADQYYIKTTENYASYVFSVGDERRVRFEIAAAENSKDNVKESNGKQRRFLLTTARPVEVDGNNLTVRFDHRPLTDGEKKKFPGNGTNQQNRINADAGQRILRSNSLDANWRSLLVTAAPTQANGERTVLAQHLERYTAKNSFDYFIHKDLGGFLRRELDLYLKNEVLDLDDLDRGGVPQLHRALRRLRATRFVAEKIITFLAQLEGFQKRLWLKKKFVLETQYCVTLDRVPEEFYSEIISNTAQVEEWKELFSIHEIEGNLCDEGTSYSEPLNIEFLKSSPSLVLDTRHFSKNFTEQLLTALSDRDNIDTQLDGLLVHGENFQALNLLKKRYHKEVECVYIDPPYNTGDSEILYKNGYLRSSWLTLMASRLAVSQEMLSQNSVQYIAVDDFEMANLAKLVDTELASLRREMIIVNHHPQGGMAQTLAQTHDYMLVCIPKDSSKILAGRPNGDDNVERRQFRRAGTAESNFRRARPNSFYAILVNPETQQIMGLEPPPTGADYPLEPTQDGWVRIYPIDSNGEERVWRRTYQSCQDLVQNRLLQCSENNTIIQLVSSNDRSTALFSNWTNARHNAGIYGANLLRDILGERNAFSYPKSVHTVADAIYAASHDDHTYVMDYFAGSGTTGHAVLNLNREDNKKRRFILVEMGDYFDNVMTVRLKKILYSENWKEGKPIPSGGSTCFFKYIRLESYEDTLDSLVLSIPQNDLVGQTKELLEDYQLRYALFQETTASPCLLGAAFRDPYAYSLSVARNGARKNIRVDLPETFNYLLGLRTETWREIDGILAITGTNIEKQRCLILWRDLDATSNNGLEEWFQKNRARFSDSLDLIYANGDHTLNSIKSPKDTWTAKVIEPAFREMMFEDAHHGQ